jgi:hypothetical protein
MILSKRRKQEDRSAKIAAVLAMLWIGASVCAWAASDPAATDTLSKLAQSSGTNGFPDVNEVLEGRVFESKFGRDVFFLRRLREKFPDSWPALLAANITVEEYIGSPDKMLRFIEELAEAVAGTDDPVASTNLARVVSDPAYYVSTIGYRPELSRAAANALNRLGPRGRELLARAFTEAHYRQHQPSLEDLADTIGKAGAADAKLVAGLAEMAFTFAATNGGSYASCTEAATRNLLRLTNGVETVRMHLGAKEVFADPGRFQTVMDAIASQHADALSVTLGKLSTEVAAKLDTLKDYPGAYRDELRELGRRLNRATAQP